MLRISFSLVSTRFATCTLSTYWTALRAIFRRSTTGLSNSIHHNVALCLPTVRDRMKIGLLLSLTICSATQSLSATFPPSEMDFSTAPFTARTSRTRCATHLELILPDRTPLVASGRAERRNTVNGPQKSEDKSGVSSFIIQWRAHLPYIHSPVIQYEIQGP